MKKINGESGQVLIFVALGMTMMLGFAAFATDVGVLLHVKREAQTAADAAALAGATEALAEGDPSTLSTGEWNAAMNDAAQNGFVATSNATLDSSTGTTLTVNIYPNITVPTFNHPGYVQAMVAQTAPTIFMKVFAALFGNSSNSPTTVGASAIASDVITSNGCVYVEGDSSNATSVSMGGNSLVLSPTCNVSIAGNLDMSGNASISAGSVSVTGAITGNTPSGPYAQNVPPQPLPPFLAALSSTTNQPTLTTKNGVTSCTAPAGTGMACFYDSNNGVLTGNLNPGVYYFDEPAGPTIQGPISGSGITIYLAGTSMPFDFDSVGTMNLSPPAPSTGETCAQSSNPYCDVVIDAPNLGSGTSGTYTCSNGKGNNKGNPAELYFDFGSGTVSLTGIVFAPGAQLFTQDKGAITSFNTDLVIGNVCMQSATLNVNGLGATSPITKVGLVY